MCIAPLAHYGYVFDNCMLHLYAESIQVHDRSVPRAFANVVSCNEQSLRNREKERRGERERESAQLNNHFSH